MKNNFCGPILLALAFILIGSSQAYSTDTPDLTRDEAKKIIASMNYVDILIGGILHGIGSPDIALVMAIVKRPNGEKSIKYEERFFCELEGK